MGFTNFCCKPSASNLNAGTLTGDTTEPGDAAAFTYAGGTFVRATGVFTVASGNPQSDGVAVGDFASVYTTAGATVATFVGRVTARNTTTITVSTTAIMGATSSVSESANAATLKVGGAWAGPSGTTAFPIGFAATTATNAAGDPVRVNIKGGSEYVVSQTSGSIWATAGNAGPITWEGYTTSYGDGGLAIIAGTGGGAGVVFKLLVVTGTAQAWKHLHFKGNYAGSPTGGDANGNNMVDVQATNNYFFRCLITGAWRMGLQINGTGNASGTVVEECSAWDCNNDDASDFAGMGASEESTWINCLSIENGIGGTDAIGFYFNGSAGEPITAIGCIAAKNTNAGFKIAGATPVSLINCVSYDNDSHGVFTTATSVGMLRARNCIFVNNGGYGISSNATFNGAAVALQNNAFYNNTSGQTNNVNASFVSGSVTLTGVPFTDAANGDFSLNNTAGQGADCRQAGRGEFLFSSLFYSESTTSYPSIGAAEPDVAAPAAGQTSYTFG